MKVEVINVKYHTGNSKAGKPYEMSAVHVRTPSGSIHELIFWKKLSSNVVEGSMATVVFDFRKGAKGLFAVPVDLV